MSDTGEKLNNVAALVSVLKDNAMREGIAAAHDVWERALRHTFFDVGLEPSPDNATRGDWIYRNLRKVRDYYENLSCDEAKAINQQHLDELRAFIAQNTVPPSTPESNNDHLLQHDDARRIAGASGGHQGRDQG